MTTGTPPTIPVLVVDDNKAARMVAKRMLKLAGMDALTVEDGDVALEVLREHRFDLILMDIHMPSLDGLETTRRIRESDGGKNVWIVAVSASELVDVSQLAIDAGMDDYVAKPLTQQKLQGLLERSAVARCA